MKKKMRIGFIFSGLSDIPGRYFKEIIMTDYHGMWAELGLDLDRHDEFLAGLGPAYQEIYLNQESRPEGMQYFDFVTSEVHGLRIKELLDLKKNGHKVMGTFCVYVPEEIVMAAGGVWVGVCGGAQFSIPDAERILPRNLCPLIKSAFGFMEARTSPYYQVPDFFVGESTCDGKKKVWEIFGNYVPFYTMDIPNSKTDMGKRLWWKEVIKFKEMMEKESGISITPEILEEKIKIVNSKRKAMARLFDSRKFDPPPISGKDALLVSQIAYYDDPERFTAKVNMLSDELEKRVKTGMGIVKEKTPRIMISGTPFALPFWKLHHIVETSKAVIVCEESCVGTRYFSNLVEEGCATLEDKLKAIAERYVKINCSCFTPNEERIEEIAQYVKDFKIDGVILFTLQFCLTYSVECIKVQEALKRLNVPVLEIETDYGEQDLGQLQTRIEAFIEQIS
jgi:benzoyl-CoA reductase/2-hydroxyglutaryl-CoA dehydratase subunit BcrC/BadD/HgdB